MGVRILVLAAALAILAACGNMAVAPYDNPCSTTDNDRSCLWKDSGGGAK